MLKKDELVLENSKNVNPITSSQNKKKNHYFGQTNKNIINKIHLIKNSINNNNSINFHFIRRKNNFRRANDKSSKKFISRSKSKAKEIKYSSNKFLQKQNIINGNNKNNSKEFNSDINLNKNFSLNKQNFENNNIFVNNTSNPTISSNNIIITINNYNKISPAKTVEPTKIIEKKKEIKDLKQKNKENIKKREIHKFKKMIDKKNINYYINRNDYNLSNRQNNIYNNNNIYLNQVFFHKNDNNNIISNTIDDNNIDNLSINTYNTINKSNTMINSNSNNNTTNREYSNKKLLKKTSLYQDNILLKKKELEMYSPLSFLKRNLEVDKTNLDDLQLKEKTNINNTKINSNFNSSSKIDLKYKNEGNNNKDDLKNINENYNQNNDENLSDIILDNIDKNIKNKNQVSNILSALNRIKNTKQLYKNKQSYGLIKLIKKKENQFFNSNKKNKKFLKAKPFNFLKKRENSFNEHLYYSRSNSKNSFRSNFGLKYKNSNKNRKSKSNKKIIDRSFMSENTDFNSSLKKSNNLSLSNKNINNKFNLKNIKHSKIERNNNIKSLNTSINEASSSPVLLEKNDNNLNNIHKNDNKKRLSISTYLDSSVNNNNKIIDTYEYSAIKTIDKHCNSLLSKINEKIKLKENGLNIKEVKNEKNLKKIIANASLCRKGMNRPEEESKINQDTLFKVKFGDLNFSYYGVCDGHGPLGHLVSDFVKSNLVFIVYKQLKSLILQKFNINNNNPDNHIDLKKVDDSFIDFPLLFKESFLLMESKLLSNKAIDIELSGTTCISLLFCSDRIISSNLGDSRAIKGYYDSIIKKWQYIPLSRDHKPSQKDEAERIKKNNGIIHPFIDEDNKYLGPDRVWNEGEELPGLAMSRSFGDEIAKKVGVISEPEVKIFPYKNDDKFIVIASDGLWEYVSNEEVLNIVGKYHEKNDCDGAVSELCEIAKERWDKYDDYIDDISIIVIFIDNII